ncbi:MAG: GHKL domain-containing protein [Actinomycetales bacterium]|nr:GHKL domain-containing protein [Actinomycetales bacterium]
MRRLERANRLGLRFALLRSRRLLAAYEGLVMHLDDPGVVVVDAGGRVRVWNDGATRMLGRSVPVGTPLARAVEDPVVARILLGADAGGVSEVVAGRTLHAERLALGGRGRSLGRVTLVRDRTEELRLATSLDAERDSALALRARIHEADNRLHTVVSLVELGHVGQAVDFATATLARSTEWHESIQSTVADPVLAALLLGKAVTADEARVALHVDPATTMPSTGLPSQDLVLLLGNLIDNAIDAAAATPPPRWVHVLARTTPERVRLEVSDSGPGLAPAMVRQAFAPGWTTKGRSPSVTAHGQGLGLSLVEAAVGRLGGTVSVERWIGARFVVEIPLTADAVPAAAEVTLR